MSVMLSPAVEEGGLFKGRPTNAAVDFAHFLPKETEQPAAVRQAGRQEGPIVLSSWKIATERFLGREMGEWRRPCSGFQCSQPPPSLRISLICSPPPRPRVRLTLGALMTCYYGACGRPRLDTPAPAAAERPNLSCRTIGTTRAIFPRQNAFRILQRH